MKRPHRTPPSRSSASSSSTSSSASFARREKQVDRILAQVKEQLLRELPGDPNAILTIDEVEKLALEVRDRVGRAVAQELSQEQADAAEAEVEEDEQSNKQGDKQGNKQRNKHHCQRCLHPAAYRGSRSRTIITMAGAVYVTRRFYYCKRCDHCTMPVDQRLGLPIHGYTALVEQWVAELCAEHAYHRGVDLLSRLARVEVSKKEAQRITLAVGEWLEQRVKQQVEKVFRPHAKVGHIVKCQPEAVGAQRCERGKTLYVLMDGVMTPMKDGSFREAKVGCSFLVDHRVDPHQPDKERQVQEIHYTHSLDDAQAFGRTHYTTTAAAGLTQVPRVVSLADGAHWIWNQVDIHYPGSIQILDWYHALEHLWTVGKECLLPAHSEAEVSAWVKHVETWMWQGQTEAVIRAVKALPAQDEQARECRRLTVEYYRQNQERMHYDRYRAQGFHIGSGTIESGCKQVVSARIKGAGMRWSEAGARAIGKLRAALLSTGGRERELSAWCGRQRSAVATC